MLPDDRLDALLSSGAAPQTPRDDGLRQLVETANRLEPLRRATPRPAFAGNLHDLLQARAAAIRAADATEPLAALPTSWGAASAPSARSQRATNSTPLGGWRTLPSLPRGTTARRTRRSAALWQAAAAILLCFLIGSGFLAAGASAAPGSPLYGLRLWEQGFRAGLTSSPGDKVRLHLGYASDALKSFDGAVANHGDDGTLADALTTLLAEQQAATQDLASVPAGSEHDALATQLTAFQQQARGDLHVALTRVDWTSRLRTTTALGGFGEQVLVVTTARISHGDDDDNRGNATPWRFQVQGTGFVSGAILVVNGQQSGTVLSVTPTLLVAKWTASSPPRGASVGVQNPDGTSAQTTNVYYQSDDDSTGTRTPSGTPTVDH